MKAGPASAQPNASSNTTNLNMILDYKTAIQCQLFQLSQPSITKHYLNQNVETEKTCV
uniref:Uncharacterized protein n=1 Tax=Arion vulgaris TaxID=1028688 RepID=A0A0B7BA70_9EUPU